MRQHRGIIIAIDGPTASGKSTTAQLVAERLGFLHLNTGAMYRAFALNVDECKTERSDEAALEALLERTELRFDQAGCIELNGRNVAREIKDPKIAQLASELSALPVVRKHLVKRQQELGANGAVVLEGRDIGTVVFPQAELKIFLVADPNVRAERRQHELEEIGTFLPITELEQQIMERDRRDRERELSPLTKAPDAIELDTTHLSIDAQVERVVQLAKERMAMGMDSKTLHA